MRTSFIAAVASTLFLSLCGSASSLECKLEWSFHYPGNTTTTVKLVDLLESPQLIAVKLYPPGNDPKKLKVTATFDPDPSKRKFMELSDTQLAISTGTMLELEFSPQVPNAPAIDYTGCIGVE